MNKLEKIELRKFLSTDYPQLINFFIKAYGSNTIFQNTDFLNYYFSSHNAKNETACLIAIDKETNEIVSHYGGLYYKLLIDDKPVEVIWGVNAYTLPDYRGQGINSKIVDYIHNNNAINAVIGMPFDAPYFYKKLGYNIFNKNTLSRYIYVLSDKIFEIIAAMPQDTVKAHSLLKNYTKVAISTVENIIRITANNIDTYSLDFNIEYITTTFRDIQFLKWRLLENPYVDYDVFAVVVENKIKSYIAIREETLMPHNYKVGRIIDLYGDINTISPLLEHCKKLAEIKKYIYVDFSSFGSLYSELLKNAHFIRLDNDDYSLLPQVTSPIENRPNHEFIVIQSKYYSEKINLLNTENTYFTRIDADRDRISKVSQVKIHHD